MLFGFILLLCIPYAIIKGIKDGVNRIRQDKENAALYALYEQDENEKRTIETLILKDQLNAYNAQIESYSQIIEWLEIEIKKEKDGLKAALLRKKQSDIAIKAAKISEKAYKLENKLDELGEG